MGVILSLLNESLLCAEQQVERFSEPTLRGLLTAIMIGLAVLNPAIGVLLMCAAILRYVPVALTRAPQERLLADQKRCVTEKANAAQSALEDAQGYIQQLEQDLIAARKAANRPGKAEIDSDYHAVGLHEGAPTWLIESARRAYRLRLHPDRHPDRHKAAAHTRFVEAEARFDMIYQQRGIRA